MRRLPPLTAVEAFVQVARLGSVKAAAEELALSSPALSRRIQSLERFVGRPLFERRHQAMILVKGLNGTPGGGPIPSIGLSGTVPEFVQGPLGR